MSNEPVITSPPYPGRATTVRSLYRDICSFREWILEQQREIYERVPPKLRDRIVSPPAVDTLDRWQLMVAVEDHYTAYRYVRHIREWWDQVVREHEDSWDSRLCVRKRFHLLNLASYVVQEAFVDAEKREAKEQDQIHRQEKMMKAMHKRMQAMMEEDDYSSYDGNEETYRHRDGDEGPPQDSWEDWANYEE